MLEISQFDLKWCLMIFSRKGGGIINCQEEFLEVQGFPIKVNSLNLEMISHSKVWGKFHELSSDIQTIKQTDK